MLTESDDPMHASLLFIIMHAAKSNETETLHNKSQASLHPPVQKKGWNLFLRKAGDIFELALSGLL